MPWHNGVLHATSSLHSYLANSHFSSGEPLKIAGTLIPHSEHIIYCIDFRELDGRDGHPHRLHSMQAGRFKACQARALPPSEVPLRAGGEERERQVESSEGG